MYRAISKVFEKLYKQNRILALKTFIAEKKETFLVGQEATEQTQITKK